MSQHTLKTWPAYFDAILDGRKTYEIRVNDRDYKVGDILLLQEWNPIASRHTEREIRVLVTYMTEGGDWGIPEGHCVMAVRPVSV
jgi:hypothetical protein